MQESRRSSVAVCMALAAVVGVSPTDALAAKKDRPPPVFRLAGIFTDNMVLQQDKPIVVWGWAKAGSKVAVTLTQDRAAGEKGMAKAGEQDSGKGTRRPTGPKADDGAYAVTVQYVETNPPKLPTQTVETKAADDGRWHVTFKPAKASFQPTWIIARSGDDVIGVRNILIGEIWVCAGQSNMGWGNFNRKGREAASANFPGLRYVAWHDSWYKPLDDIRRSVAWQVCSPESAQRFSAVPYLYGMFLHRYLKVPVGIINVARGGTLGQAWCLRDELDNIDNTIVKTVLKDYDAQTAMWEDPRQVERIMAEWKKACEQKKVEHAEKVAQLDSDDPFSFVTLSLICQKAGRIPEAEQALMQARQIAFATQQDPDS